VLNDRTKTNYLLTKLDDDIREQIEDALYLISLFDKSPNNINQSHDRAGTLNQNLNDYSFLVFPAAKAYEGFLKKIFRQIGVLPKSQFYSRQFRIGRSFNPDLPPKLRDEQWLYDEIESVVGNNLAREMWQIWIDGRNHIFHYFPNARYKLSLSQAKKIVNKFLEVMLTLLEKQQELSEVETN
jgi:hypothetical protein